MANAIKYALDKLEAKIGTGGGSGEAGDHSELINRDIAEQHPISAITNLQNVLDEKVDKVSGKELSTNDYDSTEKSHVSTAYMHSQATHAPTTAEKNVIVGIQKNNTDLVVDTSTRKVNISVPTKLSELTNDAGFITETVDDSLLVHKKESETITGLKTFTTNVGLNMNGSIIMLGAGTTEYADVLTVNDLAVATEDYVSAFYVAQEDGKGLSSNDYTTAEKNKLAAFDSASSYAKKTDIDNKITYGTQDLSEGVSELETGKIYVVYEE